MMIDDDDDDDDDDLYLLKGAISGSHTRLDETTNRSTPSSPESHLINSSFHLCTEASKY